MLGGQASPKQNLMEDSDLSEDKACVNPKGRHDFCPHFNKKREEK